MWGQYTGNPVLIAIETSVVVAPSFKTFLILFLFHYPPLVLRWLCRMWWVRIPHFAKMKTTFSFQGYFIRSGCMCVSETNTCNTLSDKFSADKSAGNLARYQKLCPTKDFVRQRNSKWYPVPSKHIKIISN